MKIVIAIVSLALLVVTTEAQYTTIDPPGSLGTYITGISGNNVVGTFTDATGNHSFLYNGSSFETISDPLGANGTQAVAISGTNIVGTYTDGSGASHSFLYDGIAYTTIDALSGVSGIVPIGIDGNNIIGSSSQGYFLYNGSSVSILNITIPSFGGVPINSLNGISVNNLVGTDVYNGISHHIQEGFIYNFNTGVSWTFRAGSAPASITQCLAISGDNVVGMRSEMSGGPGEFFLSPFLYQRDLNSVSDINNPLGVTQVPTGIDGTNIVGNYTDSAGVSHGFETYIGATPEPSTLAIVSLGAIGLIVSRFKKAVS